MTKRMAVGSVLACITLCAAGQGAQAQPPPPPGSPAPGEPGGPALSASEEAPAEVARYGVAVRFPRWVSMPKWFLNIITKQNQPLSTFNSFGAEFFRRKGDLDIVVGFAYQSMSPEDGNWLGKGKDAAKDTDYVQVRGLGLIGLDAAFVWRTHLNENFSLHYGAGLGIAFVKGQVLRTSNSTAFCNDTNAGSYPACRPAWCPETGCTEEQFKAHEGIDGTDEMARRFKDQSIPGAIPILQLLLGVDFRIPDVKGFEARLQGGFYDGFFAGMGLAYVF
jgi:hypothetical protein